MHISFIRSKRIHRSRSGQALIESAIMIPFVLTIIFNAINYGYFFYVAQNMSAAVHSGALYSMMGGSSTYGGAYPAAGTSASDVNGVANLVYQDMQGALPGAAANASVRVCSPSVGTTLTGTVTTTNCSAVLGPSTTFPAVDPDPENPNFLLNRVDVAYTFNPLIPGAPFSAVLLFIPNCSLVSGSVSCTFKAHVSMRAM